MTGSIYLFKPQIEGVLYNQYYDVQPQGDKIAPAEQIEEVEKLHPDATVTSYRPGESADRSSEVGISTEEGSSTVFIDPYTGKSLGELKADDRIIELKSIGLSDASMDDFGYVMATLPANTDKDVPTIGFLAHVDTATDFTGKNVNPQIHEEYDGGFTVNFISDPPNLF